MFETFRDVHSEISEVVGVHGEAALVHDGRRILEKAVADAGFRQDVEELRERENKAGLPDEFYQRIPLASAGSDDLILLLMLWAEGARIPAHTHGNRPCVEAGYDGKIIAIDTTATRAGGNFYRVIDGERHILQMGDSAALDANHNDHRIESRGGMTVHAYPYRAGECCMYERLPNGPFYVRKIMTLKASEPVIDMRRVISHQG